MRSTVASITKRRFFTFTASTLPVLALLQAAPVYGANTVFTGADAADSNVIKEPTNWTASSPGSGKEGLIDDSVVVPSTLFFGNAAVSIGVSQTIGALTINSSTLTALNANAGAAPASSTTFSVAFAGNTGNTIPFLSLGSNVTQSVSISDTANAILNLQIGVTGGSINVTNSSATLTIASKLIDSGAAAGATFTKTGAGTLSLKNTTNNYGGAGQTITISGGALSFDVNSELGNSANTITLDGGTLTAANTAALTAARSVKVDSNGGGITTSATTADTLTLSSALTGSGLLTKTGAAELVLNSATGSFNGTIAVNTGNLRLINNGSTAPGTIVQLNGANSTLNLRGDTDLTYNANVEVQNNTAQIFVDHQSAGPTAHLFTLGTLTLGSKTLNVGGSDSYALQMGAVTLTGDGIIATNSANLSLGPITESGSHSFSKAGGATLDLTGIGNWTGDTNIKQGTLQLGIATALPSAATPTFGNATGSGILDLNGFSPTLAGLSTASGAPLGLSSASAAATNSNSTLTFTTVPSSVVVGSIVSGAGIPMGTVVTAVTPTTATLSQGFNGTTGTQSFNFTDQVIGNSSGSADSTINIAGGTSSFGGIIQDTLGAGTKTTALAISSGSLTLAGANTYTGDTSLTGGTLILASTGTIASSNLTIGAGATATVNGLLATTPAVTANGSITFGAADGINSPATGQILTRTLGTLTVGATGTASLAPATDHSARQLLVATSISNTAGKIDLANNDLVDVAPTDAESIVSQLQSGFNAGSGYWNGATGIVSTTAAADTTFLTTLSYRQTDGSVAFDGQTPAAGATLVKYTYYGDANLDGTVDGADYQQIDMGFGINATGWVNGDFNYDGVVNGSDFALIDNTFNQLLATGANPLAIVAAPATLAVSSVPEPATLGLLSIGALSLLRRRRNTR